MRNVARAAIKSKNLSWGRTLATVHEGLALELRAHFGRADGQPAPLGMKKANRTVPPRFTPQMIQFITEVAEDGRLRSQESIKAYAASIGEPTSDKMVFRIFMLLARVMPAGGVVEVFTKGERHKITVAPSASNGKIV